MYECVGEEKKKCVGVRENKNKKNVSCKNIFDFRDKKKKPDKKKVRQRIKSFSVIKMRMLEKKNYYTFSLTPP